MKDTERDMFADFIMGMRGRGREEDDSASPTPENQAAENLYGEQYEVIRKHFTETVAETIEVRNP